MRLSPTKLAKPSQNPLFRDIPSHRPRLRLDRPTIKLARHPPARRHGALGLEASAISGRRGRQHRRKHRLIYVMRLTPATLPQTLTRPSSRRRAYETLTLSFDYVRVPSVVSRLPSRPRAMSLPYAGRLLAPHLYSGVDEPDPTVPHWQYHFHLRDLAPRTRTVTPR